MCLEVAGDFSPATISNFEYEQKEKEYFLFFLVLFMEVEWL